MTITDEESGNGAEVTPFAAGDPPDTTGQPLILTNAYFELTGVNLRCLVNHVEVAPDVKKVTVTTLCNEQDFPGAEKWSLKMTFQQSFDVGAVNDTLTAALAAYRANGTPANFKIRPFYSRPASANNPIISGFAIPEAFPLIVGDAAAASEVQIEWTLTQPATVDKGAVAAAGATAGAPGFFTPSGATTPANLAALTGVVASPATAWTTGQYVITADLLANNWTGTVWAAGKHA